VNTIRKFFISLWYTKERILLVVMLLILCWRVFQVVSPPDEEAMDRPTPPPPPAQTEPPPDWEGGPPERPIMPGVPPQQDYSSLHQKNPFWFHGTQMGGTGRGGADGDEVDVTLESIQVPPSGEPLAKLVAGDAKWYKEGEAFQSYQVLSIDPDAGTCEIYSEKLGQRITLRVSD
jgi:hypothetical protein